MRSGRDTLLSMVALLCLSLSLGLFTRIFLPEAPPLFAAYHGVIPDEVEVVTPERAFELYQEGGAAFVDAREMERYAYAHIPGALNLPVDDYDQYQQELILLRTSHLVVVYCEDQDCGASKKLVELLLQSNVSNLVLMPEGISGWQEAGYPVLGGAE
ncbi:MAG: rhodanese-like domain-containing protein [Candidatus Eremiobacteraeota bacterium]|nr:rhodanese-like domain-containing protein [Candidatus Eremiobacteraeota bacterium]